MAHLTKSTGDPVGDAVLAFKDLFAADCEVPYDIMIGTAKYAAWAYHQQRLTADQQREALGYYALIWIDSGLNYG